MRRIRRRRRRALAAVGLNVVSDGGAGRATTASAAAAAAPARVRPNDACAQRGLLILCAARAPANPSARIAVNSAVAGRRRRPFFFSPVRADPPCRPSPRGVSYSFSLTLTSPVTLSLPLRTAPRRRRHRRRHWSLSSTVVGRESATA